MTNNPTYHDLLAACPQPGCPVCRLVGQGTRSYLERFFFDSVNDIRLRQQLRSSLGFCRDHTWLILHTHLGDPLGVAIIYTDVVKNILRGLPASHHLSGGSQSLTPFGRQLKGLVKRARQALTPQARCLACEQEEIHTQLVLGTMLEALPGTDLPGVLAASDGLCLPHLRQALELSNESTAALLLQATRNSLERLQADLAELIRKNDYRFRDEAFGPERDAWKRVAELVAGTTAPPQDSNEKQ